MTKFVALDKGIYKLTNFRVTGFGKTNELFKKLILSLLLAFSNDHEMEILSTKQSKSTIPKVRY
jgi:hypothetical protein